jgi:hypothetical protein
VNPFEPTWTLSVMTVAGFIVAPSDVSAAVINEGDAALGRNLASVGREYS